MGRRNEWEIYGIRNVSQFCKTTIKHEATKQRSTWPKGPEQRRNSLGPFLSGATRRNSHGPPSATIFTLPNTFPATPSQHQHQQQQSENKETDTKQRQKIGGAKRRRRGETIKFLCACPSVTNYIIITCVYIYYWIGRLSSCLAWPSLPLPLLLLEIFDL